MAASIPEASASSRPHTPRAATVSDVLEAGDGEGDPNLRSIGSVTGYHIQATDGPLGHLENFLVDEQTWTIAYLAIATKNWWPGQHVLVAPVAAAENHLARSRDRSHPHPRDDPAKALPGAPGDINFPAYQALLHDHYGWPPTRMAAA